jgi:hypothetical protein
MRQILILFTSVVFLCSCCKKDDPADQPKTDITLSSELLQDVSYYTFGYSFELQKFIKKTISTPEIVDIYLVNVFTSGKLTGVQFATKEVTETTGFYRNNSFDNSADATQFYDNYVTAVAPQLSILTDTVGANQVWTFKTWKKNYVKFLVKDVRKVFVGSTVDYIEVDIKYFIQRDGSTNLTE